MILDKFIGGNESAVRVTVVPFWAVTLSEAKYKANFIFNSYFSKFSQNDSCTKLPIKTDIPFSIPECIYPPARRFIYRVHLKWLNRIREKRIRIKTKKKFIYM